MQEIVEVKRFSDTKLQAAIESALTRIPEGHKLASVAHADGEGVSLTMVAKLGDQWSIAAACYKPWGKPLTYEAEVVWTPF